jgi:hypothetical protein
MAKTQDECVVLAGVSDTKSGSSYSGLTGESEPLRDLWIAKVNLEGKIVLEKILIKSTHNRINSIQQLDNGDFIAAGIAGRKYGRNWYFWVLKLDPDGNIIWERSFGGSDHDTALSIKQSKDGGYIMAGTTYSKDGDVSISYGKNDYWIVKLNFEGELEWEKSFGGSGNDVATDVYADEDGFVLVGRTQSNDGDVSGNHGGYDYWIVKIDLKGDIVWQRPFGGSRSERASSIIKTTDNCYIVAGSSNSNDGDVSGLHDGYGDYWIIKVDPDGNLIWQKLLGGSGYDVAKSLCHTMDGGIIVAGSSKSKDGDVSNNQGGLGSDYWIVKLSINK